MYKVKKLICTLLAVCIISTTLAQPVQAFTGAEGAILGGGGALASISLTAPQVALLVAAGFGLVVAVENADKLAEGMTAALDAAAAGVDAGAETLAQWLETAKKGSIAIASAPAWLAAALKGWISGLYESVGNSSGFIQLQTIPAGSIIPSADFWHTSTQIATSDVQVVLIGRVNPTEKYINLTVYKYLLSSTSFKYYNRSSDQYPSGSSRSTSYKGTTYHYTWFTWGSSPEVGTTNSDDLLAISSVQSLPQVEDIKFPVNGTYYDQIDAVLAAISSGTISDTPGNSVCPDKTVGGIGVALEEGKSIDDVNMPDLDVAGSKSICPDGVLDGSIPIADTVADVIVGLTDGTMSWSDYVADVAVGTPTISVPIEGTETGVVDYPITDTGVSDMPIEENPDTPGEGTEVPEGLAPYTVQLKDFFPFCIPFDIVDFVGVLCADPVAPSFEWTFTQYSGQKDTLEIDLAPFDEVAQLLRNMELLLFIIGLAFLTRNLIRG